MRKIAFIAIAILLSAGSFAQTPFWFSSHYMDFEQYTKGHDEVFFTSQVLNLKGKVRHCTIQEIVPDSKMEPVSKLSKPLAIRIHNLSYAFNAQSKPEYLDLNMVTISYREPETFSTIERHGFVWDESGRLQLMSVLDMSLKRIFLSVMDYDANHQVQGEHWFGTTDQVFTYEIPFALKYDHHADGSCLLTGTLKTKNDSIVKYTQTFDDQGRMTNRKIFNRDLGAKSPNDVDQAEVFDYVYDTDGRITKMSYTKGNNIPFVYFYTYTTPDEHGNFQVQKVLDSDRKLLYEISWKIEYFKD